MTLSEQHSEGAAGFYPGPMWKAAPPAAPAPQFWELELHPVYKQTNIIQVEGPKIVY